MEVGEYYSYVGYTDDTFECEEISIEGYVIYKDDKIAIVKVDKRYMEMFFYILYYDDLKKFYPAFFDSDAKRSTEYLCLDVESEVPLYFTDPETDDIHPAMFDEDHFFIGYDMESVAKAPADYDWINMFKECVKREMEMREQNPQKFNLSEGKRLYVCLSEEILEELKSEGVIVEDDSHLLVEEDSGNLSLNIKRAVTEWFFKADCAMLTAWRQKDDEGKKISRKENDRRNKSLMDDMHEMGYRFAPVKGCYREDGNEKFEKENSFLVFSHRITGDFFKDMYTLSERYKQDSFLFRPQGKEAMAQLIFIDKNKSPLTFSKMHINSKISDAYTKMGNGMLVFEE